MTGSHAPLAALRQISTHPGSSYAAWMLASTSLRSAMSCFLFFSSGVCLATHKQDECHGTCQITDHYRAQLAAQFKVYSIYQIARLRKSAHSESQMCICIFYKKIGPFTHSSNTQNTYSHPCHAWHRSRPCAAPVRSWSLCAPGPTSSGSHL